MTLFNCWQNILLDQRLFRSLHIRSEIISNFISILSTDGNNTIHAETKGGNDYS
jgi:hypothetical protein